MMRIINAQLLVHRPNAPNASADGRSLRLIGLQSEIAIGPREIE